MGRIGTWSLVAGVAALAVAATVDAVRGGADGPRAEPPAPAETEPIETDEPWSLGAVEELETGDARGALLVADASCEVRELELPGLVVRRQGRPVCAFTTSPGGWIGPEPRVLAPGAELVARCRDGAVEVFAQGWRRVARFPGCAPAWTPDGRLAFLRDGELVVASPCDERWSCEETLVGRDALARLFGRAPWAFRAPVLREVAWLSRRTVAAIVRDPALERDAIAVLRGAELVGGLPFVYERLAGLRASPRGSFAAARVNDRALVLVNREGKFVGTTFRGARAVTWSPDERWSAFATGEGVYVVPASRPNRPVLLRLDAVDVAWR